MIDIAKLQQEHEKALTEALACNAIEASMPVPPKRVTVFNTKNSCPWVSYEVDTLQEAVTLLETFDWVPICFAKNGCAVIRPDVLLGEYTDHVEVVFDGAPVLNLQTVDSRIFTSELSVYAYVDGRLVKVIAQIKQHPARIHVYRSDAHNRRGDVIKNYPSLHEDKRVVWGSGGDYSASASYLWGSYDGFHAAMNDLMGK